jgi:hypothetical protein
VVAPVAHAAAAKHDGNGQRHLEDERIEKLATRCFTYCIEDNYTPEECQLYIQMEIEAAGGHEVGDVTIKIQVPRKPEDMAKTYWMVEVPVNIHGKFSCDRNEGHTDYPFKWKTPSNGDLDVDNLNCQGKSAGECCLALREHGQTELGGYDENGYCLACFAHQELLTPIRDDVNDVTDYRDHVWDGSECVKAQLTITEVSTADGITEGKIEDALAALEAFSEAPSCLEFDLLLVKLYDAAVLTRDLSMNIGELACNYCYDGGNSDNVNELGPQHPLIKKLTRLLKRNTPSSLENCVIIYTNEHGDIVDVPQLGGSRADERYEEDCEDDVDEP